MLRIGEFAELSAISINMLRHYDRIGLLPPARVDERTGYRYYEECQLVVAKRIRALRAMGLGLSEIARTLCFCASGDSQGLSACLATHAIRKRRELDDFKRQLNQLEATLAALSSGRSAL